MRSIGAIVPLLCGLWVRAFRAKGGMATRVEGTPATNRWSDPRARSRWSRSRSHSCWSRSQGPSHLATQPLDELPFLDGLPAGPSWVIVPLKRWMPPPPLPMKPGASASSHWPARPRLNTKFGNFCAADQLVLELVDAALLHSNGFRLGLKSADGPK